MSSLPESKKHLKQAIKERIQFLVGAYISLASFVDDDLVDFLEECGQNLDRENTKKVSRVYKKVFQDMEKLRKEIKESNHFEIPTLRSTHLESNKK